MSDEKPIEEVIDEIVSEFQSYERQWKDVWGWAPNEAADLLEKARLDWLTSLAMSLKVWLADDYTDEEVNGRLILAYANLGSLLEGVMKFFLSVYVNDYSSTVIGQKDMSVYKNLYDEKNGVPAAVDGLMLEKLRQFFEQTIWDRREEKKRWNELAHRVKDRRNAIHAYQDRPLGTFVEFYEDVREFRAFLDTISLPDPPPVRDHEGNYW